MLYQVPPTSAFSPQSTPQDREAWSDVVGRSVMAAELLLDSKPGMLDMMVGSTYPGQAGAHPVIGEDVLAAARKLTSRDTSMDNMI